MLREVEEDGTNGRTWTRRISAPASASAIATAWPIPRVAPVMRAVWPSRENIFWTLVVVDVISLAVIGMNGKFKRGGFNIESGDLW